ncbi:MAG: hypothetical protein A2Y10_18065 [Planctomycetes bacterium GWF2_41_51]|nr:MAG: hypothetical protein A2Y10_18065 [Planctomycetes bacterium GWF2_41_51]
MTRNNETNIDLNLICEEMLLNIQAANAESKNRTFNMVAYTGGQMRVMGWYDPVVVDLFGLKVNSQSKPIFFGHEQDLDSLVGQTDLIKVEAGQLIASGDILGESDRVKQILSLADKGFKWQASIGARAEKSERLAEDQTAKVNGRQVTGPATIVRKATLGEISFVMLGADDQTSAQIAANKQSFKELFTMANEVKDETKEVNAANTVPDITAEIRAKASIELTRIAEVRKAAAGNSEIEAKAVAEGWDVDKTKLRVLEANLAKAPAVGSEMRLDAKMIEAAACLSASVPEQTVLKVYGEQATNQAEKYRRIGIQDLFRLAAKAEGIELPSMIADKNGFIRAAFSTVSLPNILSNVANKILLDAYLHQENSWRPIVKVSSVNDFKTHSRYRLTDNMQFVKVGADGELKHGKLGEQVYTQKAETSGIMFSLNRQTIINDDMSAFADIPRMLGIGAADAISDAVWALIMAGTLYSTNPTGYKANYATGAATALSVAALTAAELLFLNQQKPNGKPLGLRPKYLVVPNALKVTAQLLMTSIKLNEAATAGSPVPEDNPHVGQYEVIPSSWLGNTTIAGNSTKAWYMFADPARLASYEIAFLNGVENPTIESADADFNTLGMQFRGYIDFGVAVQDPRASVKLKGEA